LPLLPSPGHPLHGTWRRHPPAPVGEADGATRQAPETPRPGPGV